MRRKVNNSEIHEIKKYYEVPSEKVQEWSDTIEELSKQIDRYKAENEQLKEERESMISDYQKKLDLVHMLKDEINELKQELHSIYKENEYLLNVIKMSENIEIHSDAYDEMEKGENNKTHHIPHLTDIKTNENIEEPMKFIKRIAKERADDER